MTASCRWRGPRVVLCVAVVAVATRAPADDGPGTVNVRGHVFLDTNRDGVRDPGETGLPGVYVSNGLDIRPTDASGSYALRVDKPHMPFVFIIKPTGYRTTRSFYRLCLDLESSGRVDFGLGRYTPPDAGRNGLTFFHVSDIHAPMSSAADQKKMLRPLVDQMVSDLKTVAGQFIVNTGDTANQGTSQQFADVAAAVLPGFTCTTYHVPGNHDFDNRSGGPHYTNLTPYHRHLGPNYYAFNYLDNHFIVLDAMRAKDDVYRRQLAWVRKDLALFAGQYHVVVLSHSVSLTWHRDWKPVFAPYRVLAELAGHQHFTRVWERSRGERGLLTCVQASVFHPGTGGIDGADSSYLAVTIKRGQIHTTMRFLGSTAARRPRAPVRHDTPAACIRTGADWPMFQHDPLHSGRSEDVVRPPLQLRWVKPCAEHFHMTSPIIADGKVIVALPNEGIGKGGALALDAATGREVWRCRTRAAVRHTPCAADGRVVFSTSSGETCCAATDTGKIVWRRQGGEAVHTSHAVADGILYAGIDGRLRTYRLDTGQPIATSVTTSWPYASYVSPAVGAGRAYYADCASLGLFCFDEKLKTVWNWVTKEGKQRPCSHASVVIHNGKIFWAVNSHVFALRPATAEVIWKVSLGPERIIYPTPIATPCVAGKRIYVASEATGVLMALDTETGRTCWEYRTGPSLVPYGNRANCYDPCIFGSPVVSGDVVYVGANDGCLHAVDAATGQGIARYDIGTPITSAPAISGNAVVVTGRDGCVYAFSGQPGRPRAHPKPTSVRPGS